MEINAHYKNIDITKTFGVAPQGGMRRHGDNLILISKIYHNIYPDEWHGQVLNYSGMGQKGDQDLNFGQNKTLKDSNHLGIHVFLFINEAPNDYIYAGPVKLIDKPFSKRDPTGRKMIIFPIAAQNIDNSYQIKQSYRKSINYSAAETSTKKLIQLVKSNERKGKHLVNHKQKSVTSRYVRNRSVAELSKRFAKGKCQLCGMRMFIDERTHEPFIESHHINWLSHKGKDSIKNVIALCLTCHMKMHHGPKNPAVINDLKQKALRFAKEYGFFNFSQLY